MQIDSERVHQKVVIQNNFKLFPSGYPVKKSKPLYIDFKKEAPELSIVIPTFFREESFDRVIKSILLSNKSIKFELVIFDNTFASESFKKIKQILFDAIGSCGNELLTRAVLYNDPFLTFPSIRNFALSRLVDQRSSIVSFWDSDIICNKSTISKVCSVLEKSNLAALAPPLLGITDLKSFKLEEDPVKNYKLRQSFQMPGKIGEKIGYSVNNKVLLTGLLRGCFFIKKSALFEYYTSFGTYFPEHFIVWSNVPFFCGLRELDLPFGYLYEPDVFVVHDDVGEVFTLGKDLANRELENLKSITFMCIRNKLYECNYRLKNELFVSLTSAHIRGLFGSTDLVSEAILQNLISLAGSLVGVGPSVDTDIATSVRDYIFATTFAGDITSNLSKDPNLGIYNVDYKQRICYEA